VKNELTRLNTDPRHDDIEIENLFGFQKTLRFEDYKYPIDDEGCEANDHVELDNHVKRPLMKLLDIRDWPHIPAKIHALAVIVTDDGMFDCIQLHIGDPKYTHYVYILYTQPEGDGHFQFTMYQSTPLFWDRFDAQRLGEEEDAGDGFKSRTLSWDPTHILYYKTGTFTPPPTPPTPPIPPTPGLCVCQ
jgi:hypothetical protein